CSVEQALKEDDRAITTTKPVYNGKKLGIERCRSASQFGEPVFDELMRYLPVVIRIAGIDDQTLELEENHHQQCCCNCDNDDDYCISGVLAGVTIMCSAHIGMYQSLLKLRARAAARRSPYAG